MYGRQQQQQQQQQTCNNNNNNRRSTARRSASDAAAAQMGCERLHGESPRRSALYAPPSDSRGRLAAASEARLAGTGFGRELAGPTDLAAAGSRTGVTSARVVQTARGPLRGASSPSPTGRTKHRWVAAAATRDK